MSLFSKVFSVLLLIASGYLPVTVFSSQPSQTSSCVEVVTDSSEFQESFDFAKTPWIHLLIRHAFHFKDTRGGVNYGIPHVRKDLLEKIDETLSHPNFDVNATDEYGRTALMIFFDKYVHYDDSSLLTFEDKKKIFYRLINNPDLDINAVDTSRRSSVMHAALNGNLPTFYLSETLQVKGIDPFIQDVFEFNLLMRVAQNNSGSPPDQLLGKSVGRHSTDRGGDSHGHLLEKVRLLMSLFPEMINESNDKGQSAIMMALQPDGYSGVRAQVLEAFVDHPETNLALQDKNGNTVYHLAVRGVKMDFIELANRELPAEVIRMQNYSGDTGLTTFFNHFYVDTNYNNMIRLKKILHNPHHQLRTKNNAGQSAWDLARAREKKRRDDYDRAATFAFFVWDHRGPVKDFQEGLAIPLLNQYAQKFGGRRDYTGPIRDLLKQLTN